MLQTLPLLQPVSVTNILYDPLLYELLHARRFSTHAKYCKDMQRHAGALKEEVSVP